MSTSERRKDGAWARATEPNPALPLSLPQALAATTYAGRSRPTPAAAGNAQHSPVAASLGSVLPVRELVPGDVVQ